MHKVKMEDGLRTAATNYIPVADGSRYVGLQLLQTIADGLRYESAMQHLRSCQSLQQTTL